MNFNWGNASFVVYGSAGSGDPWILPVVQNSRVLMLNDAAEDGVCSTNSALKIGAAKTIAQSAASIGERRLNIVHS